MDWLATKTHELLLKAEDAAIDAARRVITYQPPEDAPEPLRHGHDAVRRSVSEALTSWQNHNNQHHTRMAQHSPLANQEQRKLFDRETERLLQAFLYEQYAHKPLPQVAEVCVDYETTTDFGDTSLNELADAFIGYLMPKQASDVLLDVPNNIYDGVKHLLAKDPESLAVVDAGTENSVRNSPEWLLHCIDKDIVRTDRLSAFFHDGKHDRMLRVILFLYALYHPEVGYVQGMCDLLAPLVYLSAAISHERQFELLVVDAEDEEEVTPYTLHYRTVLVFWMFEALLHGPHQSRIVTKYRPGRLTAQHQITINSMNYNANFLSDQSGVNTRLHLLQHTLKWLDPVFYQHLIDMDNSDRQTTSNPLNEPRAGLGHPDSVDNLRMKTNDDDWTVLEPIDAGGNTSSSSNILPRAGLIRQQMPTGGALSFFWLFRSILLLFKRDVRSITSPTQEDGNGTLKSILHVWLRILEFRQTRTIFPEVFVAMALMSTYIRPMLIPTWPLDRPDKIREMYHLPEVDVALEQMRELMWRDVFQGVSV